MMNKIKNNFCKLYFLLFFLSTACFAKKNLKLKPAESPLTYDSGRLYYDSLIEKASKRHWAFSLSVQYTGERGGYDCAGCSGALSNVVFAKCPIRIQDVYLFSKLSIDNKVRINNCDALVPNRGDVPIGGVGVVFGGFSDDLYTTLLAPVQIVFSADQKEVSFQTSGMYRFDIGSSECFSAAFGYILPIKSRKHSLDFTYQGGDLFTPGFVPDTIQRENTLKQFFRDYVDVEDFINRAVFGSKGLCLVGEQTKSGIGDISLFGLINYQGDMCNLETGLNILFPSGSNASGSTIWEPILGCGAYQFNPFMQALVTTSVPYLNPFGRMAVEVSSGFTTNKIRVPTLVTNEMRTQVKNVAGLSAPDSFQNFYVDPFSEFDSCVPLLSTCTPCISKKIGPKILIGLGNYAYQIFNIDLRWGLFYDYFHKSKDSFDKAACTCCDSVVIDACAMERGTDQSSHSFGTNLIYKFSNLFELGAGGQVTFLGKNIPRYGSFYISFVAVF